MENSKVKWISWKSFFVCIVMVPVLLIPYFFKGPRALLPMHLVIVISSYIALAQTWNILSGLTGMFSLGHAAFYGLGGYGVAVAMVKLQFSPWFGLMMGILLAAFFGMMIGFISSRLTGFFFTISTIALSQVIHTVALQWAPVTNGVNGLKIFRPIIPRIYFFYAAIMMAVIVSTFFFCLRRSRTGSMFVAIRENAHLARSLGVNIIMYKTISSVLSASIAAVVGAFMIYYIQVASPSDLSAIVSDKIIMVTIIGGMGYAWGPVLGSVLILFEEIIRGTLGSRYAPLATALYGVVLIAFMLFRPNGIVSINLKRSFKMAIAALTPQKPAANEGK
ncbi:branched-chain amino acid ABC transporter permease [Synergistales bacterium]|nr:branched-chain amino acid ABC transporter permease [Synergistales bacterium]